MPEIDIQRREGMNVPWWAWLVGAALTALLIWWIVAAATPDRRAGEPAPQDRVAGERQEQRDTIIGGAQQLPLTAIQQDPAQYHGNTVSGVATVAEVVSDRGFWVEQNGSRLFVLDGQTVPGARTLQAGDRIQLEGPVYRTGEQGFRMPQVEGMDEQTARTLQEQQVFMHATSIQSVNQPTQGQ